MISVASLGSARFGVFVHDAGQQRLVEAAPVHADADRLVVPAGDLDQLRELLVAPRALADVAGIDAQLGQCLRASRMLGEQLVAVEMEIADQRHIDIHLRQALADLRHGGGGLAGIDRDAHQFGAGARQLATCIAVAKYVLGIGVGHRLDDHGAGAVPPTPTFPTMTRRLGRRAGETRDIALIPG
jgi:hypothetical protein